VAGRRLDLVALDDGYRPEAAAENTRALIERHQVFALVGNVGTPTARLAAPVALAAETLLFAPLTGAELVRPSPPSPYLFHYRADYAEEARALVSHLVDDRGIDPRRIAVFAQDDDFGEAGVAAFAAALGDRPGFNPKRLLQARYERNTLEVSAAAQLIMQRRAQIDAILMVATYAPAARFVQKLRKNGIAVPMASLSFVGSRALAEELRLESPTLAADLTVAQVVPPYDADLPGVARYRASLAKYFAYEQPDFVSLEGYLAGRLLALGLERAGAGVTTASLAVALEGLGEVDLGLGAPVRFDSRDHQASHRVWLTVLGEDGGFRRVAGAWGAGRVP